MSSHALLPASMLNSSRLRRAGIGRLDHLRGSRVHLAFVVCRRRHGVWPTTCGLGPGVVDLITHSTKLRDARHVWDDDDK
ncbi:hypothetical protein A5777_03945 [Gordonia sp. 852002-10350_SCH5691597]|nr:hypothetical protein A5777_03945 [Gordonia sp. 852002-10350_SCH5691597]